MLEYTLYCELRVDRTLDDELMFCFVRELFTAAALSSSLVFKDTRENTSLKAHGGVDDGGGGVGGVGMGNVVGSRKHRRDSKRQQRWQRENVMQQPRRIALDTAFEQIYAVVMATAESGRTTAIFDVDVMLTRDLIAMLRSRVNVAKITSEPSQCFASYRGAPRNDVVTVQW